MELLKNGNAQTTLSSGIDNSTNSIPVTSAAAFPATGNFRIRIDNEILLVTSVSGSTFTATRAQESTAADSHSSGANVDFFLTAGALAAIRGEMYITDTWANRPSAPRTGTIFATTNSNYLSRYNGSSWEDFGPVYPITPPSATFSSNYTWHQQGTATITQNGSSWIMKIPTGDSTGLVRQIVKTAPSTPYTIEAGLRMLVWPANFTGCGLTWKQSSDDKHLHAGCAYHSGNGFHFMVDKYNGNGGFNSTYIATGASNRLTSLDYPEFWRTTDNGTNRIFEFSVDGRIWNLYHTVGRTDFLTANQVGFGIFTSHSHEVCMEIFHYKEY